MTALPLRVAARRLWRTSGLGRPRGRSLFWVLFMALALSSEAVAAVGVGVGDEPPLTVLDFEDHPANGPGQPATDPLTSFYAAQGVTFNGPVALDHSQGLGTPGFARSGSVVLEPCYGREFCTTPIEMAFRSAQARVGAWVGDSSPPGDEQRTVVLVAFDFAGIEIARDSVTLPLGTGPISVDSYLEVTSATGSIASAVIRWEDPGEETNGLAVDDVEFESPVAAVSIEPETDVDFGEHEVGAAVSRAEFVIRNIGNVVTGLSASLDGSPAFDLESDCDGGTLNVGERCIVRVSTVANEPGVFEARLDIQWDVGLESIALALHVSAAPATTTTTSNTASTLPSTTVAVTPATSLAGSTTAPVTEPEERDTRVTSEVTASGSSPPSEGGGAPTSWIVSAVIAGATIGIGAMTRSRGRHSNRAERRWDALSDASGHSDPPLTAVGRVEHRGATHSLEALWPGVDVYLTVIGRMEASEMSASTSLDWSSI